MTTEDIRKYPVEREFILDGSYRVRLTENRYREIYVSIFDGSRLCRGSRCIGYRQVIEFLHRFKKKGAVQNENK